MHYAQIEERATFECFITLSLCPTGLCEITQGYCEVFTHVCLIEWQNFTVRKPTQQKFWWNVNSYYRTWLLIYKVYCKYISCIENIVKTSWVTCFLQPGMTSSSTSYHCQKRVNQYCFYKSITSSLIVEWMFHIQAIRKIPWPTV